MHDGVAVTGEKGQVDKEGESDAEEVADDQADEKGCGFAVELYTAEAHDQALGRPGDEDRCGLIADHPDCRNG